MMHYPATFELPTTDNLTGLLTGPYFRHLLQEKLLPHARESGEPLSLGFIDIDSFLQLNNEYGHRAGDQVLAAVARTLQETMLDTAVLGRYGGDELVVALPDTRIDDAFSLAEEFRRRVAALPFAEWPELHVTCSIGLAAFPGNGPGEAELIREADQALYIAKSTGRNKVALPLADSRMVTK